MNMHRNMLTMLAFSGAFVAGAAAAGQSADPVKLLTATFAPRQVVQVEIGDFHFKPGQIAPIHTHDAPAIGYVAKGMIIYQIEGEKPRILREGDAFFEPVDARILRFDNASATEEAIFIDFNLEQESEPFIVFEHPPAEAIDRRALPTATLSGASIDEASVFANDLAPNGTVRLEGREQTLGLVAQGVVELRAHGEAPLRIAAGGTFALPADGHGATIANASAETRARLITLRLN